jgi:Bacterial regulatory helix-turn-helix protein, lysR family
MAQVESVELRDLGLAVIAAEHRSLRKAAEAINIRQSTLSRRLRDLEHRFGAVTWRQLANERLVFPLHGPGPELERDDINLNRVGFPNQV